MKLFSENIDEFSFCQLVRMLDNELLKFRNRVVADFGLTSSQSDVLYFLIKSISRNTAVCQQDIQKQFALSGPTVTGILNRLEEKGFIVRVPSKDDARFKYVSVTEKAVALNENIIRSGEAAAEKALSSMDEDMRQSFTAFLKAAICSMKDS